MVFHRPLHQCTLPFSGHGRLFQGSHPQSFHQLLLQNGFILDVTWSFPLPLILFIPCLLLLPSLLCSYWFSPSPITRNSHPATASLIVPFLLVSCQVFYSRLALFAAPLLRTSCLAYPLTLNMEVIPFYKTSLDYLTTWSYRTKILYSSRLRHAQYVRNDTHLQ